MERGTGQDAPFLKFRFPLSSNNKELAQAPANALCKRDVMRFWIKFTVLDLKSQVRVFFSLALNQWESLGFLVTGLIVHPIRLSHKCPWKVDARRWQGEGTIFSAAGKTLRSSRDTDV